MPEASRERSRGVVCSFYSKVCCIYIHHRTLQYVVFHIMSCYCLLSLLHDTNTKHYIMIYHTLPPRRCRPRRSRPRGRERAAASVRRPSFPQYNNDNNNNNNNNNNNMYYHYYYHYDYCYYN